MSEHELEPLSADIEELFDAERLRADPDPASGDRVFSRAALTLGLGLGGGGGPVGSGSADPAAGVSGASAGATGVAGAVGSGAASLGARTAWIALTTFVLGGLGGAGLHAALGPRAESRVQMVQVPVTVTAPATVPTSVSEGVKPEDLAIEASPSAAPSGASGKAHEDAGRASRDDDLTAERELLSIARTAVARGQGDAALAALDRHASQFPRGRLAEERESLRIQALIATGRKAEAQDRAKAFGKQFPNSLQKKAIETSIGEP